MKRTTTPLQQEYLELKRAKKDTQAALLKIVTLQQKVSKCLTDVNGQPWDDIFYFCWKRGHCCSQNADFLGFTQLLAMRFPKLRHMDICFCKVLNNILQWRSRNVGTFWFPVPGLCKKLWPQKTLFSGCANGGNFVSAGKIYTCPGSPVKWVDYARMPENQCYRPLREDQVNALEPCYDLSDSPNTVIQHNWEKDPLLDIYNVTHPENKEEETYLLEQGDTVLYDDDGRIIGIWDFREDNVLEARRVK